jgi:hypothetical protein
VTIEDKIFLEEAVENNAIISNMIFSDLNKDENRKSLHFMQTLFC